MHYFLMLLLSFVIVASLRSVGVILVVAMLVTPASTALLLSSQLKRVIIISATLGVLSSVLGLICAIKLGTTPGPAMTLCATFFYFLAVLFSPSQGLLFRYNQNRIEKRRILREDILRQVVKQQPKGTSIATLSKRLALPEKKIKRTVSLMAKSNLLAFESGSIILTAAGIDLSLIHI